MAWHRGRARIRPDFGSNTPLSPQTRRKRARTAHLRLILLDGAGNALVHILTDLVRGHARQETIMAVNNDFKVMISGAYRAGLRAPVRVCVHACVLCMTGL